MFKERWEAPTHERHPIQPSTALSRGHPCQNMKLDFENAEIIIPIISNDYASKISASL